MKKLLIGLLNDRTGGALIDQGLHQLTTAEMAFVSGGGFGLPHLPGVPNNEITGVTSVASVTHDWQGWGVEVRPGYFVS